jgi:phosphatidylserine decarboxylase
MKKLFIIFQFCIPQRLLSRLLGRLAECRLGFVKNSLIRLFIRHYQVNMTEAERQRPEEFSCFNDFFTRHLRADARPLDTNPLQILSPADGAVSALGIIKAGEIFQAKGKSFSLQALLGDNAGLTATYQEGHFATIYLSPRDYHRVHMPASARLQKMIYVPGKLFSVNQTTAEGIDNLFARNERAICHFQTERGPMAMILVGALIVAGIATRWAGQIAPAKSASTELYESETAIHLQRGEEMGLFNLGSTVILLFPPGKISWKGTLETGSAVRMGQAIGQFATAEI